MNTQENNKLIAEFMGFTLDTPTNIEGAVWYDNEEVYLHISSEFKHSNCFKELQFHTSWDWLMPVIDKVYEEVKGDMYPYYKLVTAVQDGLRERSRGATYNAVVKLIEFINQYKNK